MESIVDVISSPEYNFLQDNIHLGNNLLFVTFGGSHAYGIPVECSDIDIRGCTVGTRSDILGMSTFNQYSDKETDTVIYSFFKTVAKIISGDIRMIEMLCCEPEQYALVSALGQQFLDARKLFFTQRVSTAYIGYIHALKETLDTAGTRMNIGKQIYEKALLSQCQNAIKKLNKTYPDAAKAYIQPSGKDNLHIETYIDINLEHCPVRDLHDYLAATGNILTAMENAAAGRNYIDRYWVSKKMTEFVRSLYTCCDLLETGELKTCRTAEREQLLSIREGRYVLPNSTIDPKFYEMIQPLEARLEYAKNHTNLPNDPDMNVINEFVMNLNQQVLNI